MPAHRAGEFGISRDFDVDLVESLGCQSPGEFVAAFGANHVAAESDGSSEKPKSGAKAFEPGGVAGLFAADFGLLQARLAWIGNS